MTSAKLFVAQYVATLFMTGLIWFVQIVHYPLFATVFASTTPEAFRFYANRHATLTGWVVFPPMFMELLTAMAALVPTLRPGFVSRPVALGSAILVILVWISTALIQVPLHTRLARAPDQQTIRRLVRSNWLRTLLWTARAILLSAALCHTI